MAPLPTDPRCWKRVLNLAHPDSPSCDESLFIWLREVQRYVASNAPEDVPPRERREPPRHRERSERVDFSGAFLRFGDHSELVRYALSLAKEG